MARLYCMECHTVVGESGAGWHGDRGTGFGLCQTCGQHGGVTRAAASSPATANARPGQVVTPPGAPDRARRASYSIRETQDDLEEV
jgi:hypothetical protein